MKMYLLTVQKMEEHNNKVFNKGRDKMNKFNIKNIEKLDSPERRKSMPPEETLLKFEIK